MPLKQTNYRCGVCLFVYFGDIDRCIILGVVARFETWGVLPRLKAATFAMLLRSPRPYVLWLGNRSLSAIVPAPMPEVGYVRR